jgi:6-phospho-3-hexuloisomerase
VFEELSAMAVGELSQVFARMCEADVRPLLEAIEAAPRIFTVGAGREGLATKSFAMRLAHLGKESHWIWDDTTPAIGPGDLLICAAGSADIGHLNHVCRQAKAAGAALALVTAAEEGYLRALADVVARVPAAAYHASGDLVPSGQLMGNLFEQALFITYDVLAMMLRLELGLAVDEMVARHRNVE